MFDLKTASLPIRKAAAQNGIRTGKWEPIFEPTDAPERAIAKVYPARGEPFVITASDAEYADSRTWAEIA